MKKGLWILFIILFLLTLYKIDFQKKENEKNLEFIPFEEVRAIYVSYIELSNYLNQPTVEEKKQAIVKIIENIRGDQFNWILLHTRSFSDSIYPSQIFPINYLITRNEKENVEFDVLQEFIDRAHENNIQVHAWINPYRIRNDANFSSITPANPCFKWIGSNHIVVGDNGGIFYNPASVEARNLILSGIEEIVERYDIDGIHFDDYFYPDGEIDLENYEEYKKHGGTLSLDEYRLENVNELIRDVYKMVKEKNPKLLFGIAPDGNIENNYHKNYADIFTWLSKEGYLDYVMPQIYYGFQNQARPFVQTLNEWNSYIENETIQLIPALALYKSGNIDEYAKSGKEEWVEHANMIVSQIKIARNMKYYSGFSIFRYDNMYGEQNENMIQEVTTLRTFLEK